METVLQGRKSVVHIAPNRPTVIIGKRISPAMRKRPTDETAAGDIEIAKNEALAQVAAGADVVDVSMDMVGVEEVTWLPRAVEAIQEAVEVPISIDTPNPEASAAALKICQGKPLVNAVNGEEESLSETLPLVAKHGAAVIGLCVDEEGIPDSPGKRLAIARKIVKRSEALGIPREDVLIDCLTLAVETNRKAALATLEAIRLVRAELGVNMVLDTSNISSDLPNCATLHQAFLSLAIAKGVTAPIVNAAQARQTIVAMDVLLGRDESATQYIKYYHYYRSGMRGLIDWELVD
jgi:5-methyltetrahydrofolate--homocysteine methyltransferase